MTPPKRLQPLRPLLTGVLALLPLAATISLLAWSWQLVAQWLGPGSVVGGLLTRIGLGVAADSPLPGYLLGLVMIVALVYLFGLLVETGLQRGLEGALQALVQRIPIVRTVYDVAHRLVGLIGKPGDEGLKSMRPVWLYFGGPPAEGQAAATTAVLALLTTQEPVLLSGQPFHGVLVPTAPVPVGGGLLFVPAHWVLPADIGIEGVTSIYVSMGVTADEVLGRKGLKK